MAATTPTPGTIEDRAAGVVVAGATGDALGSAYEFGLPLSPRHEPRFGRGVFGHDVGEWTDDTAMAVPILDALAAGRSLREPATLAQIVARWREWAATAKDVGTQTRAVLGQLGSNATEDAARAAADLVHAKSGRSAGNGSLMRTGPVALGFLADGAEPHLVEAAGRIAQLTHAERDNVDAVVLWSLAIRHGVRTGELDARVGLSWRPADRRERWSALPEAALAAGADPRPFHTDNGWVVRALQGALAAVAGADDLRDALVRAVRGGGDTDTVAAIAGSLAGAIWGASAVPAQWRTIVHGWPGDTADDLARQAVTAITAHPSSGTPRVGGPASS